MHHLQAVIDEEPWALALAAVEEELSAKEGRLAALEGAVPEIDLKVTALQADVEDLNLGYKIVTSGRNCKYITTQEECLEAAKALGLAATTVSASSSYSPRPPGCRTSSPTSIPHFNTDPNANADCGHVDGNNKWDCICKK